MNSVSKVSILFIAALIITPITSSAACWDYYTIDDLSFTGDKTGQKRNLLDLKTAQRMFCSVDRVEAHEVTQPLDDIKYQENLLEQRLSKRQISKSAYKYYKSWLSEMKSNLFRCYRYAYDLRELTTPLPEYKTRVKIKHANNPEVIEVSFLDEQGNLEKKFLTHHIWMGRVIGDAGFSLCQAEYNPSL